MYDIVNPFSYRFATIERTTAAAATCIAHCQSDHPKRFPETVRGTLRCVCVVNAIINPFLTIDNTTIRGSVNPYNVICVNNLRIARHHADYRGRWWSTALPDMMHVI